MLVPIGLSPMYELPTRLGLLEPRVVTASLDVLAVTVITWVLRRSWAARGILPRR